jgi:hypothetical protein
MNTLYTFGCSFTENFDPFIKYPGTTRYDYIFNFCNGVIPKSWPQIMSKELNMDLRNHGGIDGITGKTGMEGNCNFSIFNNICMSSEDFKKGDFVIIEWTYMERFKWADFDTHRITTLTPSETPNEYEKNVIESILINRTHKLWIEELFKYQILINKLADTLGVKLYYWTIDKNIINYKIDEIRNNKKWLLSNYLEYGKTYQEIVRENGGLRILDETNGEINDDHMGSSGHKVLSNLFLKHIQ